MCRPSTRPALVALLALTFLCAVPALARADCPPRPLDRTFLPWLDAAWYEAAPDSGLESGGAGWTLAGGAAVTDGNNPYLAGHQFAVAARGRERDHGRPCASTSRTRRSASSAAAARC